VVLGAGLAWAMSWAGPVRSSAECIQHPGDAIRGCLKMGTWAAEVGWEVFDGVGVVVGGGVGVLVISRAMEAGNAVYVKVFIIISF
jgi:hypothetical protein